MDRSGRAAQAPNRATFQRQQDAPTAPADEPAGPAPAGQSSARPADKDLTLATKLAPAASSGTPGSGARTDAAAADSRIAAPPTRNPQPARVFGRNSRDPSIGAVVAWVPPAPGAAQEALASRLAPSEETAPAAGQAPPPASPASPSTDTGQAPLPASAVPPSTPPAPAKAAARRAWDREAAASGKTAAGTLAEAGVPARASEPGKAAARSDPQPGGGPTPPPHQSDAVAPPGPVSESATDSPAESHDRVSPAHMPAAEGARVASLDPHGMMVASFADFADSADAGSAATRPAPGPVAFEVRVTPQPQEPSGADTPARGSAVQGSATLRARTEVPLAAGPQVGGSRDSSRLEAAAGGDEPGDASPAVRKQPAASGAGNAGAATRPDAGRKQTSASQTTSPEPGSVFPAAERATPTADLASAENRPDAAAPRAPEIADRTAQAPVAQEASKPPTPARDMQFAVGGGDQRVEVRLAERGGELHVAVHTPDQRLAGSLRDDLPSLTARLESAGLRAETWHAGSSGSAGRERPGDTSSRTLSQNPQEQPGQDGRRQRDDAPPQRAKPSEDSSHPKRDRKEFQWLLTSLR
ncbi:MAG TPA: hypothetical protein VKF41_03790 [Bryobacteraceae bacterium]|nr:hypothetical protein [Bryobacteraceae bacterium]